MKFKDYIKEIPGYYCTWCIILYSALNFTNKKKKMNKEILYSAKSQLFATSVVGFIAFILNMKNVIKYSKTNKKIVHLFNIIIHVIPGITSYYTNNNINKKKINYKKIFLYKNIFLSSYLVINDTKTKYPSFKYINNYIFYTIIILTNIMFDLLFLNQK